MEQLNESYFIERYNILIHDFMAQYASQKQPIDVNFRELVYYLKKTNRATHCIHSYPAKLLMHIPHFFLLNTILTKAGSNILDPFCGSGTVLLESLILGRNAFGCDINPIAKLISRVKTTKYNLEYLKNYTEEINIIIKKKQRNFYIPHVPNVDYWFYPKIQEQLILILNGIHHLKAKIPSKYIDFFLVCFSACIKQVSTADPRINVPVKLINNKYPIGHPFYKRYKSRIDELEDFNVTKKFFEVVESNILRFQELQNLHFGKKGKVQIISDDARKIKLKDGYIDLVLTSPPYSGAQKYIRSSSLHLGWLGYLDNLSLQSLNEKSIGREGFRKNEYSKLTLTGLPDADEFIKKIFTINPTRAYIIAKYLNEMNEAFSEVTRTLKEGGYFVLVAGNNMVCGKEFETQKYLSQMLEAYGLRAAFKLIDNIRSYGLMTKRNKTADIITREWVLVYQKP